MKEKWEKVDGWPAYEVSSLGKIKNIKTGKFLKCPTNNAGRPRMTACHNGAMKDLYVHQVVAAAFLGPCPRGLEINHINGDKADNRSKNLEYVTHFENVRKSFLNQQKKLKINIQQVYAIRRSIEHPRVLAAKYSVSTDTIHKVRSGKMRSWLPEEITDSAPESKKDAAEQKESK